MPRRLAAGPHSADPHSPRSPRLLGCPWEGKLGREEEEEEEEEEEQEWRYDAEDVEEEERMAALGEECQEG